MVSMTRRCRSLREIRQVDAVERKGTGYGRGGSAYGRCLRDVAMMLCAVLLLPGLSWGQKYPSQPVRLVVPFPPGGGADILARTIALKLTESLRVQVLVENRAGAGGMIGSEFVARATPDGHILVLATSSSHAVNPHIVTTSAYDPVRDFTPVMLIAKAPNVLVIHPSLPARSTKELIALAKARSGELNIASNGTGTLSHLMAELLMLRGGIKMVHVPYKGAAPAVTETVGGHVSVLFAAFPSVSAQVRAGRLRALAVTSAKRTQTAPELPTIAESGLRDFEASQWWGVCAPAGLPSPIVERLSAELGRAIDNPDVKKQLSAEAAEIVGGTPRDLAVYLKADYEKWGEVVRAAGLRQ